MLNTVYLIKALIDRQSYYTSLLTIAKHLGLKTVHILEADTRLATNYTAFCKQTSDWLSVLVYLREGCEMGIKTEGSTLWRI